MDVNIAPYDITSQLPRVQQMLEQQVLLAAAAQQQQQQQLSTQSSQQGPITYPCPADTLYIQQQFASGAAPTLVIPPTTIPLYPGYAQVPPGPGFVYSNKSKYSQLLTVIDEMGKDLRPTYSGSKTSCEKFKRGIAQARILLRECLAEHERAQSSSNGQREQRS